MISETSLRLHATLQLTFYGEFLLAVNEQTTSQESLVLWSGDKTPSKSTDLKLVIFLECAKLLKRLLLFGLLCRWRSGTGLPALGC